MIEAEKYLRSCLLATILLSGGAPCETLPEAVQSALSSNAAFAEAKAKQKSLVEQVRIARASGRPNLTATSNVLENYEPALSVYSTPVRAGTTELSLVVPLYSGGSVKHAVRAARWAVEEGEETLLSTRSRLITSVVSAYVGTQAARQIVAIDDLYVKELEQSLVATKKRFSAGELTKTDIEQVQTALSSADGTYLNAVASLRSQEAQYAYLVGHDPSDLSPPPTLPKMPDSEAEAVQIALSDNPDVLSADRGVQESREKTRETIGSGLPQLQAFATGNYSNYLGTATSIFGPLSQQDRKTAQVGIAITVPLYQGGGGVAKIHDARAQEVAAQSGARDVRDSVVSAVRSEYAQFKALDREVVVANDQAATAENAYRGVKTLSRLGDRNTQDVLNAEQAALVAKSQIIEVDANRYISAITLLAKMGVLPELHGDEWAVCEFGFRVSASQLCKPSVSAQGPAR